MLCYEYPPLGGGGAKVVYGLSNELVRLGYEVDLVTMGYRGLPRYEEVNGVKVYRVPCIRRSVSICSTHEMISYIFSALNKVIKLVKQNQYYLNHTHFIFPDGVVSFMLKKLTGFPYIITAHGSDVPGYNPDRFKIDHKLLSPLWRKVVGNAEQIVCLSENLKSLVLKQSSNIKIVIIPNGMDIDKFRPHENKKERILVVSRMFRRKGIQYFIEALKGLEYGHEVNIVGDGPYLGILRQLADELMVRVRFWGWLDNTSPDLKKLYETSSIFVFPSESENFPIVLLEAMAAGMAIITTKDTGCAEVVGDSAILVEPRDSLPIKEALIELMNNPDLCKELGSSARRRLEDNFSWNSIALKYINLYEKNSINEKDFKI